MKYKTFKSMVLAFLLFFMVAIPFIGIAAGYIPLEPLGLTVDKTQGVELGSYFSNMYKLIIGIAGVLAVLMIVIAGIEYMSPTPSGKESGKKRMWAAISGLVLALISYLILNTINPDLLGSKKDFGLTPVEIIKSEKLITFPIRTCINGECEIKLTPAPVKGVDPKVIEDIQKNPNNWDCSVSMSDKKTTCVNKSTKSSVVM